MPGEQPYLSGLEDDERLIVEEMLHNPHSKHWEICNTFVTRRVYAKAKDIPRIDQEEIIQEIMYKAARYLSSFRFECTLRSWLYQIIEHCITDKRRKFHTEEHHYSLLINSPDEKDGEGEETRAIEEKSTEEVFETHEKIRDGINALYEYARTHSDPVRNQSIIKMLLLGGYTYVEIARRVGCDAAVVGYMVREAQRYAREKVR